MSKLKQNKGFTLIELLVALAIVGIILLAFFASINSTIRMDAKNDRDIKALNIAQSEIENLRTYIKNYEKSSNIKIENVIDISEYKIGYYEVNPTNENFIDIIIPFIDIHEEDNNESTNEENKSTNSESIDYDIEYIKGIDNKKFRIYLDISKSDLNNTNMNNEMYMYTINIKVKSFNEDPNKDNYFSKKETEIRNVKILSKNKS